MKDRVERSPPNIQLVIEGPPAGARRRYAGPRCRETPRWSLYTGFFPGHVFRASGFPDTHEPSKWLG